MICRALHVKPSGALNGTTALHMAALREGASILRVHDVQEAMECVRLFEMIGAGED
jgi:dihydropteroate synthase